MSDQEVTHDFRFFRVFKDGHLEFKLHVSTDKVPATSDPITGFQSKDVEISPDPIVSARIFLPKIPDPTRKLPVFLYVHGGGFSMGSAASPPYHRLCSALAAEAEVVVVSVEYGLFPARPIPACYEDSWAALQWVAAHSGRSGPDPWINRHADFDRVFVGGDSAGGNITHTVVYRVGSIGLPGIKVAGAVLVHPYFGGTEADAMWMYMCPGNLGVDDPRMNPPVEDLGKIGCGRVLVFVAERDHLCPVGKRYVEELKKSGWGGHVELVENLGQEHCFHVFDGESDEAKEMMRKVVSFIKEE